MKCWAAKRSYVFEIHFRPVKVSQGFTPTKPEVEKHVWRCMKDWIQSWPKVFCCSKQVLSGTVWGSKGGQPHGGRQGLTELPVPPRLTFLLALDSGGSGTWHLLLPLVLPAAKTWVEGELQCTSSTSGSCCGPCWGSSHMGRQWTGQNTHEALPAHLCFPNSWL